jgi:hypothetical protein
MRVIIPRHERGAHARRWPNPSPVDRPAYLDDPYYASVVAFDGAMGYGANATGGRYVGTDVPTLYFVDNLNDSGTGSLRVALEASGRRVIVPRVGGYAQTTSRITVASPNYTLLGQLAPGGGLGLRHSSLPITFPILLLTGGNGIVRYLSVRAG